MASRKRKATQSTTQVEAPVVTPPDDEEEAEEEVLARLSRRVKTQKEIESTVPGEECCVVEKLLPSFFDSYPRAKRALERLSGAERSRLIRACDRVVKMGDETDMRAIVGSALEVEVIDVENEAVPPRGYFQWQADGGDSGWLAYDDAVNDRIEQARVDGARECHVSMFGTPYTIDFNSLLQVNLHSTTVRPIRKVQK